MEEGVDGNDALAECEGGGTGSVCRSGDAVRRWPSAAPSSCCFSGPSKTDDRMGDVGGKASSAGFRRCLTRFGDPEGLAGRRSGEESARLATSKPGMDLVRDMVGMARLAVDFDLVCEPDRGDVVLGR